MKSANQPGTHPDAEMLTAFSEQSVSEKEREQIVAHLAGCNRCREVVFLAQAAADADTPAMPASQKEARASTGRWFAGWKLFWIPVAALAGIGGLAVLMRMDHASAPETRMAQNASPPQMTDSLAATKATPKAEAPPSVPRVQTSKVEGLQRRQRDAGLDRKLLDQEDKTAARKDETAKEADSVRAPAPDASGRHGNLVARAKSSPIGGPMQNQIQQQNAELQQNYAADARQSGAAAVVANKPAPRPATSVSQTVAVEAADAIVPASPAPASPVLESQLQTESVTLNAKKLAKVKGASMYLPSKLGVLSSATMGKRTVAIDTGGSAFVSDDAGRHWQAVSAQWEGRAVLVKAKEPAAREGSPERQAARFELTTDKPETWVSEEGKQWTLASPGSKQ